MDGKLALLIQKWGELQAFLGKPLVQTYGYKRGPGFAHQPHARERGSWNFSVKVALVFINPVVDSLRCLPGSQRLAKGSLS